MVWIQIRTDIMSEGGTGGPDPHPEKSQNIGFPSNTGHDPLKITNLPSQHSMLGHHWHASQKRMAFDWRADDGQGWRVDDGQLILVFTKNASNLINWY